MNGENAEEMNSQSGGSDAPPVQAKLNLEKLKMLSVRTFSIKKTTTCKPLRSAMVEIWTKATIDLLDGLEFEVEIYEHPNLENIGKTMDVAANADLPQLTLDAYAGMQEVLADYYRVDMKILGRGAVKFTNQQGFGQTEIDILWKFQTAMEEIVNTELYLRWFPVKRYIFKNKLQKMVWKNNFWMPACLAVPPTLILLFYTLNS